MTRIIETIAGTGARGYTGDGGPATAADMSEPFMAELDAAGNLFIAEAQNHCVRRLDAATGTIATVAGSGTLGYSGDGGPATAAAMNEPYALQVDGNGDLYIVDRLNAAIRKVDGASGLITTLAGGPDSGDFIEPNDCFLDDAGGLLVADIKSQLITRVGLATGGVTPVAGNGEKTRAGDGGPAREASILGCRAVCLDGRGNMYICEREGNGLRRVDGNGVMHTFAGTGERGYAGDGGPALAATWGAPKAIRCDGAGNVVVVDTENHAIRVIDAGTGIVTTVAGGRAGPGGDGGPAAEAGLARPHGCAADAAGNLYIADSDNHRVRVVRV